MIYSYMKIVLNSVVVFLICRAVKQHHWFIFAGLCTCQKKSKAQNKPDHSVANKDKD